VLGEVQRMLRPAVLVQVCGRADQIARHLTKPPCNQRGVGQCRDADGRVEAFADEVDHRIGAQARFDPADRFGDRRLGKLQLGLPMRPI
jgi:hypothetical protein